MAAVYALVPVTALPSAVIDPFIGTWTLDTRHSQYESGELPLWMQIVMDAQDNGVHYRSETRFVSGRTSTAEYTADYHEHRAPVLGDRGLLLPITVKRLNARKQIVSYLRGTNVVASSVRSVSPDGRRLRITTVSNDSTGRRHTTMGIYVKTS